ncbi:MAG: MlaD family protein [Myxococcota bacterium]
MTTEIKVGVFVIASATLLGSAWALTWDGVRPGESAYPLVAHVQSADGLWEGTPVRVAGVEIGSVRRIGLDGRQASLDLDVRSAFELPVDSIVQLRSTGMLGDRFVEIVPGNSETMFAPGAVLSQEAPAFDMDAAGRQVQALATEAGASVEAVSALLTDEANRRHLETTLARLAELTAALAASWQRNDAAVDAILQRTAHVAARADQLATRASPEIEGQLEALTVAVEKLDAVLTNLESITARIDRGEGTIGGLVNDREVLDELTSTLKSANAATAGVKELDADAWMTGRLQTGQGGLGTGGTVGGRLDWGAWGVETELVAPAAPDRIPLRGTLQLHRELGPTSWHLGLKEGSEGVGGALHLARERVRLQADLFDWLGRDGDPGNLRLAVRVAPVDHLWIEAAADQRLVPLEEQPPVGWLGLGVHVAR